MHLFIDTNIYLSFYQFTSDALDELDKLRVLFEQGILTLVVPEQVVHEFERNRENKISDSLKRLRDQSLKLQYPQFCKDYNEYKVLRALEREFKKQHSMLITSISEHVSEETLKADETVRQLFESAEIVDSNESIIDRARLRMDVNNPPGKKGSLGDAINWETLLAEVPEGEDLYFVTEDKDYSSPLDEAKFNYFLINEWINTKSSSIYYYRRLSDFFGEHFPDIKLASELQKDLLIRELAESNTFKTTHKLVAKLTRLGGFSGPQANALVDAALSNGQISMIITDYDIKSFYSAIADGNRSQLDPDQLRMLEYVLQDDEPESVVEDDDDLPF